MLVGWDLGRESFWQDEGATFDATGRSWADTLDMFRDTETNGSAYYSLVHVVRDLLGDAEWAMRLPSAVFAVALVPVVVLLGREVIGLRPALLAGALVAMHGVTVQYGRDARTYAMLALALSLSMLGLVRDRHEPSRRWWLLWVLCGGLAFYVHLFAALALAVQAMTLLPWFGPAAQRRRRLAGCLAMFVLMLPLFGVVLARGTLEQQLLSPIGPYVLRDIAFALVGGGWLLTGVTAVAFGWAAWSVLTEGPGQAPAEQATAEQDRRLLLAWVVVPSVVAIVLSLPERIFEARYLVHSYVPLVLLIAWVVLRSSWSRQLAAVALVLTLASGLGFQLWHRNEDWRQLTAVMVREAEAGDAAVFLDDFHPLVVQYYLHRQEFEPPAPDDPSVVIPRMEWGGFHIEDWESPDVGEAEFDCAVAGRRRVWVLERYGAENLEGRYPMFAWAEERFGPPEKRFADDIVTLWLFSADAPPVTASNDCAVPG